MDTREIHRLITQALLLRDANGMERSIGLLLAPHLPAMLDALDAAEARAEKAGRERDEWKSRALSAELARNKANAAARRADEDYRLLYDACNGEEKPLMDRMQRAEARAADARRAALEEAAAECERIAQPFGSSGALNCANAIRALAATDHAVEDTDDCLCGACLGGETCAEREDSR